MRLGKLLILILILTVSTVQAQDSMDTCVIDLTEGITDCEGLDAVSILEPLEDEQVVLQVSFDPSEFCHEVMILDVFFGEDPQGWLLDIGDSISNNGNGGDAADQSNYAELQLVDSTLSAFGTEPLMMQESNQEENKLLIYEEEVPVQPDGSLSIIIWDNAFAWVIDEETDEMESEYLFALSGQSDITGSVNFDLFVAINRTVRLAEERLGSGINTVQLSLAPSCEQ